MASTEYGSIYIKPGELPQIKPNLPVTIVDPSSSPVKDSEPLQKALDRVYGGSKGGGSSSKVVLGSAPVLKPEFSPDFSQSIREIKDGTYISQLNRYISESPTGAGSTGYIRSPTPAESARIEQQRKQSENLLAIGDVLTLRQTRDFESSYLSSDLKKRVYTGSLAIFNPVLQRDIALYNREIQEDIREQKKIEEKLNQVKKELISSGINEKEFNEGTITTELSSSQARNLDRYNALVGELGEAQKRLMTSTTVEQDIASSSLSEEQKGFLGGLIGLKKSVLYILPPSRVLLGAGTFLSGTEKIATGRDTTGGLLETVGGSLLAYSGVSSIGSIAKGAVSNVPKPYSFRGVLGDIRNYGVTMGLNAFISYKEGEAVFKRTGSKSMAIGGAIGFGLVPAVISTSSFVNKLNREIITFKKEVPNVEVNIRGKPNPANLDATIKDDRLSIKINEKMTGYEQPRIVVTKGDETKYFEKTIYPNQVRGIEVIPGRRTEVTSVWRMFVSDLTGKPVKNIYSGYPNQNVITYNIEGLGSSYTYTESDYKKALSYLEGRGYSTSQAKNILQFTAPRVIIQSAGGVNVVSYGADSPLQINARSYSLIEQPKIEYGEGLFTRGARTKINIFNTRGEVIGTKEGISAIKEKTIETPGFYDRFGELQLTGKEIKYDTISFAKATDIKDRAKYLFSDRGVDVYGTEQYQDLYKQSLNLKVFPEPKKFETRKSEATLIKTKEEDIEFDFGGDKSFFIKPPKRTPVDSIIKDLAGQQRDSRSLEVIPVRKADDVLKTIGLPSTESSTISTIKTPTSQFYGLGTYERTEGGLVPGMKFDVGMTKGLVGINILNLKAIEQTKVIQGNKLIVQEKIIDSQKIITEPIVKVNVNQAKSQITALEQVPVLRTSQVSIPSLKIDQVKLTTSQTKSPSPVTPKLIKLPKILGDIDRKESVSLKKPTKGLFKVKVRKRGEDVTIGEFETLPKARRKLKSELIETISASGIIEREGKPLKFEEVGIYGTQFRRAKSDPFRVVQKKEARIKTGGEITQILKTRKSKGGWFR